MPSYSDVVDNTPPFSQLDSNQRSYRKCDSEELSPKVHPEFKSFLMRKSSQKLDYLKKFNFIEVFSEKKWSKNDQTSKCRLCEFQFQKKQMTKISQCQHMFCQECLVQYMKYKINMMEEIICPQEECLAKLKKTSEIFTSLPQSLIKKYKKSQLWRQSMSNPNIRICPQEECQQGFINFTNPPYRCHKCKRQFCKQCMMRKHEGDCANQYQQIYIQWKRCPQCRMFIQKIEGCNHIICKCKYEFCFVCLQTWDQIHYQCVHLRQVMIVDVDRIQNPKVLCAIMIILLPICFILGLLALVFIFVVMIGAGVFIGMFVIITAAFPYLCCFSVLLAPFGILCGAIGMPIYFTVQVSIPVFRTNLRRYLTTVRLLNEQDQNMARNAQQPIHNNLIQQLQFE